MTYLQLCQLTRQECGIQGQGPSAVTNQTGTSKRVVEWVRDADLLIQTLHPDWDFLHAEFTENTVQGSDVITKPSNFGMWDRESFAIDRGTDVGRSLNFMTYKKYRKFNSVKTQQEPYRITILPNNNLALAEPADGIYEIYASYWKNITQLAANGDVPPYPDRFQRVIVARAKMFFFEDQEAWDNYKAAENEYDLWLDKLESFAGPGQQEAGQLESPMSAVRPI